MPVSEPAAAGGPDPTDPSPPAAADAADLDSELQPGTLIGEYRIDSKLGQGGMASVYAGTQPVIGKKVAIKVMSRRLCLDPIQVERFVQEARAVSQIAHPNIVDVFAFGTLPDGRSYFVMEWLPGETLAARLRRGLLPFAEAIAIMFQICDGLAAAHDKGIVHRDLKPENIFLVPVRNRRMLVKLLDFGIAKLLGARDSRVDRTADGSTPGTPGYMSPEQARGRDLDHRTDIYSLGVTAFEIIVGRRPFVGTQAVDILYQHIHALPPAPSTLRPNIPLQLERLLLQMLEKKPDRRPTIPVIEERLAELRDGPLAGETAPVPLRALAVDSGAQKPITPPAIESTDTSLPTVRMGPPRVLIVLAVTLMTLAIAGVAFKLRERGDGHGAVVTKPPLATTPAATATLPAEPAVAAPTSSVATAKPASSTRLTAPGVLKAPRRRAVRRSDADAAPARHTEPDKDKLDYMVDPFAMPKK